MGAIITRDEPKRFSQAFNFLAKTKSSPVDELTLEAYFSTLGDLPITAVEEAAQQLCREPSSFFPAAGEWFDRADAARLKDESRQLEEQINRQLPSPQEMAHDEEHGRRVARAYFIKAAKQLYGTATARSMSRAIGHGPPPRYCCTLCMDVGLRNFQCTRSNQCESCKRVGVYMYDHSFMQRCPCFETNPELLRRRAAAEITSRGKRKRV